MSRMKKWRVTVLYVCPVRAALGFKQTRDAYEYRWFWQAKLNAWLLSQPSPLGYVLGVPVVRIERQFPDVARAFGHLLA